MICPITYEDVPGKGRYSAAGLRKLSPRLTVLYNFPYTAEEQRREAAHRASRMSIQGVQPKLSVLLDVPAGSFRVTDRGGTYILKPKSPDYDELPENEDLTMRLAGVFGIEVPLHGLVYVKDGSFSYFIKRYDRLPRNRKLPVEDFAQLAGRTRDTKYDSSMEQVAGVIDAFATFPAVEKAKLFARLLFCFVTGNEDMHLKNWSLITRGRRVELAPAYDLLNTSIVLRNPEETALPVNGKRNRLTRHDLVDYFGRERLGLSDRTIENVLVRLAAAQEPWQTLIGKSFLSEDMKQRYREVVTERVGRLAG